MSQHQPDAANAPTKAFASASVRPNRAQSIVEEGEACARKLGDQALLFEQLETQSAHGRQLAMKLAMCFLNRQRIEQVW